MEQTGDPAKRRRAPSRRKAPGRRDRNDRTSITRHDNRRRSQTCKRPPLAASVSADAARSGAAQRTSDRRPSSPDRRAGGRIPGRPAPATWRTAHGRPRRRAHVTRGEEPRSRRETPLAAPRPQATTRRTETLGGRRRVVELAALFALAGLGERHLALPARLGPRPLASPTERPLPVPPEEAAAAGRTNTHGHRPEYCRT
jgi:hypothetical protein